MQQEKVTVKGIVTDAKGEAIIGANIIEKGTTNGTITDLDGKFLLTVKQNAEITISYVGFKSQTLKAQGVLQVVLEEDAEILQEVVVTGYTTHGCTENDSRFRSDACFAR